MQIVSGIMIILAYKKRNGIHLHCVHLNKMECLRYYVSKDHNEVYTCASVLYE